MSGHSHWRTIKYKKALTDKKRAKIFSKISRAITIAARQGPDPAFNPALKAAIESAREFSLPKENIEKAIARGAGLEGQEGQLEQILYEALGPEGVAVIIEAITDNRNRTLGELRQILEKYQGKMAQKGSLMWLFEQKGRLIVNRLKNQLSKDDLELKAIEAGAQNIAWQDENLVIDADLPNLNNVKTKLEAAGIKISSAGPEWVAKENIKVQDPAKIEQLFEELDDNEAVQKIYSNLKL